MRSRSGVRDTDTLTSGVLMGSGAGGYVTIHLKTDLSHYTEESNILQRVSELSFEPALSPATRVVPKGLGIAPLPQPSSGGGVVTAGLTSAPLPQRGRAKWKPTPAGKVGLGGIKPKDVVEFNLFALMNDDTTVDMGTVSDSDITDEAEDVFGGRWAGFAVTVAPSGGRFRLIAALKFKPSWRKNAKRPFQVIPVVMAFGTDLFKDHYLISLVVAQQTEERVDTSVTQPYQ